METNDIVSVIIPCYNQADYLEESVQSAIDQTYPNIEIIIVNDGSLDNTEDIAQSLKSKYPEKIRVISQKNSGVSEARNNGIKKALGKYILPLDADDKIDSEMINQCMDILIKYQVDIVYTDIQCFGLLKNIFIQKPSEDSNILYTNLPALTSLYRREVWKKNSGYNANMKEGYEDWEFWVNAFENNFKFHYLPKPLFLYRIKKESRDVSARRIDEYLTAKVILNHPNLYPHSRVSKSISNLKAVETLADYYFYSESQSFKKDEALLLAIDSFIKNNILQEKQTINIEQSNYKIGLCSLSILETPKDIEKIRKEMNAKMVLFYAPLRYKTTVLDCANFAYDFNKGIVEARGTIFPFSILTKIERIKLQLDASAYLDNFTEYIINKKDQIIKELKDTRNELSDRLKLRDNTIKELRDTRNELSDRLKLRDNTIKELRDRIKNLYNISVLRYPYRKYIAYKHLLNFKGNIQSKEKNEF